MDIRQRTEYVRGLDPISLSVGSRQRIKTTSTKVYSGCPDSLTSKRPLQSIALSGHISYNGEFSVGVVPRPKPPSEESPGEPKYSEYIEHSRWHYEHGNVSVVFEKPTVASNRFILPMESAQAQRILRTQRKYGSLGITRYGRRCIRDGAAILEKTITSKKLGFYTLTLPSLSVVDLKLCCAGWAELMHRYFDSLRRLYAKRDKNLSYVAAFEIQPQRHKQTGIPVLHAHYVAPAYTGRNFVATADELREIWGKTICNFLGREYAEHDWRASVDSQLVRKSAANYLSKYMSKGTGCDIEDLEGVPESDYYPSQWWSCSTNIKAALKLWRVPLRKERLTFIYGMCERAKDWTSELLWVREIQIEISPGVMHTVGYAGQITPGSLLLTNVRSDTFPNLDTRLSILVH
jgi:hypothetical protein